MKAALLCAFMLLAPHVHAQGCSQCKDNLRNTPPQTQAAYRKAIYVMGGAAAVLFLGTLVVARNFRRSKF